jgi:beta-lactamase regulating signal transducer with metallopeptidase domain
MLGWFAETTLVASGLAVVAALAGRLRSIGPTARHALWLVVLVKLMTPPLICWPWAMPWVNLDWSFISPPAAHAAPVVFIDCGSGDCPSSPAPLCEPMNHAAITRPVGLGPSRIGPGIAIAAAGPVESKAGQVAPDAPASCSRAGEPPWLPRSLASSWVVVTLLLGVVQTQRIIRFHRRLRSAVPAPDDLVEAAERIGERLGVRVPELLVVPELATPVLWCLCRPQLLLPLQLVKALDADRWRGILTHELAHLRRGDHWVSRLELAAGLLWWWNPLFWLTRARLDAEAELACDAWVVWAFPNQHLLHLVPHRISGARVGCRRHGPILREEIDHDLARARSLPPLPARSPGSLPPGPLRLALLVRGQAGSGQAPRRACHSFPRAHGRTGSHRRHPGRR